MLVFMLDVLVVFRSTATLLLDLTFSGDKFPRRVDVPFSIIDKTLLGTIMPILPEKYTIYMMLG